jgi:hypothetical protein
LFGDAKIPADSWTDTTIQFVVPNAGDGGKAPGFGTEVFVAALLTLSTAVQATNTIKFTMAQSPLPTVSPISPPTI